MTFNERIKKILDTECGGNNTKMAVKIGVTEASIRSWLGNSEPKASIIARICTEFGISPSWLLLEKGTPTGFEVNENHEIVSMYCEGIDEMVPYRHEVVVTEVREPESIQAELNRLTMTNQQLVNMVQELQQQNARLQNALLEREG